MEITDLVSIDSKGYHYADFPSFLAFYTEKYQNIYGSDVYLGSDSQDGQWLAIQAQAAFDLAAAGAMAYLSFSPVTAQGTGLSRVVKINGIERDDPSFSTVDLVIVGVAGTQIDNGIAIDNLQQQWNLPSPTIIPGPGTITVTAQASEKGAIKALPDTITTIYTPTLGWQTVNNPLAAVVGAPVETDGQLRERQKFSTANPSSTVFEGTLGAVGNTPGVLTLRGYENDTDSTDANGLPPHSISIVVLGGTDLAVAQAIQIHKTPGTNTYGTTVVPITDSKGVPLTIKFFRPTDAVIGARITIVELDGWSNDYIPLIQKAVADAIVAIEIGGQVILTKLYLAAYLPGTIAFGTFDITSIELKKNGGSYSSSNISLLFNEIAVCDPLTNVVVTV